MSWYGGVRHAGILVLCVQFACHVPSRGAVDSRLMRRQKVLMALDAHGDVHEARRLRWWLGEDSELPVETQEYHVAFEIDGSLMCWQREHPGCEKSSASCEVKYCDARECECMLVKVKKCSDHLNLFTEADWDQDPKAKGGSQRHFWRGLRVQYYDTSHWGADSRDGGKALESTLSCMEPAGCPCSESAWFSWSYGRLGGNLYWTPGGDESIGPSGSAAHRLHQKLSVRAYNDKVEDGNMYFVQKNVELRPTTTTTSTTTTVTTTSAMTSRISGAKVSSTWTATPGAGGVTTTGKPRKEEKPRGPSRKVHDEDEEETETKGGEEDRSKEEAEHEDDDEGEDEDDDEDRKSVV